MDHHVKKRLRFEGLMYLLFILLSLVIVAYYTYHYWDLISNTEKVREQINRMLPKVSRFLREADTYPIITVREPPFVGGRIWNIDVAENIFNLENWELSPQVITDSVQRAIGYYQDDLLNSFFRTINPFWWLMRLIAALIRIPFGILAWAGYDAGKFGPSLPRPLHHDMPTTTR